MPPASGRCMRRRRAAVRRKSLGQQPNCAATPVMPSWARRHLQPRAAAGPGPWAEMFEETQHRYKFDGRLRAELCRTAVNVPVLAAEAAATATAAAMRRLPAMAWRLPAMAQRQRRQPERTQWSVRCAPESVELSLSQRTLWLVASV